jgi:hypothetical protein
MLLPGHEDSVLDVIQTIGILANGLVLAYVVWRLERSFDTAADKLRRLIIHQQEIQDAIERIWKRVDEIETQQGTRQTVIPLGKLQDQLAQLAARIKALELSGR